MRAKLGGFSFGFWCCVPAFLSFFFFLNYVFVPSLCFVFLGFCSVFISFL